MPDPPNPPQRRGAFDPSLLGLPLVKLVLHLATAGGYGYFRDELYYLACADHPAFGYVDHPPLSILVLKVWTAVFGTSLLSIRSVAALAGALTVLVIGLLARRMGGGRLAQQMAMLAALCAPMELALDNYFSMNSLDLLAWAVAAYLLADLLLTEEPSLRQWAIFGAVLGLGLQNKISVLWLGAGVAAGLVLTGRRRLLATPGLWLAGIVAGVIFLPYVLWNGAHDFPTLEFMRNATAVKMLHHSLFEFAWEQVHAIGFAALLLGLGGLLWLLLAPRAKPLRPLGAAFAAVWLFLALSGTSRASYPAAAYAWVFAAGGVALAEISSRPLRRIVTGLLALGLVGFGVVAAPFVIPVLPVESFVRYQQALGEKPGTEERKTMGDLPQQWADRQGWPEIVDAFESAWKALPPEERGTAVIFASDYGVAGAIDHFGPARGLPKAISGHVNYWLWGPRGATGNVVIVQSNDEARLRASFTSVELHGRTACGRCMPYENGVGVWICRGPKAPLAVMWPRVKNFS
ncbi:MAG TPA: glycosyltransferase family 39 protein [Thermoanaerobaculia bacterium]|nr:glycosyltransferase family 39 protein [Thermoanaerobaculia bacterium]